MKTKHSISRWIIPFFLGVVTFNILRAVADMMRDDSFWSGEFSSHLISQVYSILMCYVYDFFWRRWLQRGKAGSRLKKSPLIEYAFVFIVTVISLNVFLVIGYYIRVVYFGNNVADILVINCVYVPLLILYYAMMRSEAINKQYQQQALQLEKVNSKQLEMELDSLKAQYHPHFLFNALNTVYFQIDEDNKEARRTVELLSELLRYQVYDIRQEVTAAQEIAFAKAYMEFQVLRKSDPPELTVEVDPDLGEQRMHPLLFQPLVENAFKYTGGENWIRIGFRLDQGKIQFRIENSLPDVPADDENRKKGVGLENLRGG